ncbi:MAG: nitrate reductase associated protein [Cyanobacteriota bacterium]|nr:nitrate reductase associated protein [Cyanobacteriota bacterium]
MVDTLFAFEADFAGTLHCIPMVVRFKLDRCGVKLKLSQWQAFSAEQKGSLIRLPCQSDSEIAAYRTTLSTWISENQSQVSLFEPETHPLWADASSIPAEVAGRIEELGGSLAMADWQALSELQRFALIKLARSQHEHRNFLPALLEFNLPIEG